MEQGIPALPRANHAPSSAVRAPALIGFVAASVTGCQPATDTSELDAMRPEWRELADGSMFAAVGNEMTDWQVAERCWPAEEKLRDCILVSKLNSIGSTTIEVKSEGSLPTLLFGSAGASNGYSCGYTMGAQEMIKRNGDILVSNQPGYGTSRWSSAYVANFMRDNGLKGQGYYPCLEILDAMLGGSMETLSTTEVTKAMIS